MSTADNIKSATKDFIKSIDFGVFMIVLISIYLLISGQAKPGAAIMVGAYMYFQTTKYYEQLSNWFETTLKSKL
jgi:hypothetical protein